MRGRVLQVFPPGRQLSAGPFNAELREMVVCGGQRVT